MTLTEQIEAAKARLAQATSAFSEDDRKEQALREELAKIAEQAEELERVKRELDLARRLDAASEALGSDCVKAVSVRGFPDTFIMQRNSKAYSTYAEKIASAARGVKVDTVLAGRQYAAHCVYDWNGTTDLDGPSGSQLVTFLAQNPGIVNPLVEVAGELAGLFAEERKS
jgi:hypothetical protein